MAAQPSPFESDHPPNSESPPVDEGAAFLGSLAEAMRATLSAQEAGAAEEIDRRRAEHIAAINARRESEASRMRELAEEDRTAIVRWAADERMRIQLERERRTRELEEDLEASLAEHGSRVEREIRTAEAAIAAHWAEVAAFFAAVADETDPVAIARQATQRPQFPSLDRNAEEVVSASPGVEEPETPAVEERAVAASSNGAAPGVPVMDPIAAKRAEWWAAWKDLHEPPELGEVLDLVEAEK
jgi:hypothetical protein